MPVLRIPKDEDRGGQGDDGGGGGEGESDYGHSNHLVLRPSDRTVYFMLAPTLEGQLSLTHVIVLLFTLSPSREK